MRVLNRTWLVVRILVCAIPAAVQTVRAATYDLAQSGAGATASYNGNDGAWTGCAVAQAIDGKVQDTHVYTAAWQNRFSGTDGQKAWLRVNLPALAAEMTFSSLKLCVRQNIASGAPFSITVYDAGDAVLETFSYDGAQLTTYTFTPTTSASGAAWLKYEHTGSGSSGDLFISEVQALFTGDYVVSVNGYGTNSLNSTNLVGGALGAGLANVQAVRFVQNANEWFEFNEIDAFDMSDAEVTATAGIGYGSGQLYGSAAELIEGTVSGKTYDGYWIGPGLPGYPPGAVYGHYLGETMPASTLKSIRYYQRDNDRAVGTYSNIQLEAFSDSGLASLIYSRRIPSRYQRGAWHSFEFLTGGAVWANLEASETYRFKINGTTKQCDVLNVFQMSDSQTGIDFNNAKLRVVLAEGTVAPRDEFQLFQADQLTGSLSEINLPAGEWDTSRLLTEGIISVVDPTPIGTVIMIR